MWVSSLTLFQTNFSRLVTKFSLNLSDSNSAGAKLDDLWPIDSVNSVDSVKESPGLTDSLRILSKTALDQDNTIFPFPERAT